VTAWLHRYRGPRAVLGMKKCERRDSRLPFRFGTWYFGISNAAPFALRRLLRRTFSYHRFPTLMSSS
jgi:hypothetical protein